MDNAHALSIVQLLGSLLALGVLFLVGFYLVRKVRSDSAKEAQATSDLLTNFREMHAKGELTLDEYRTIKTKLLAQLQAELKDNEAAGYNERSSKPHRHRDTEKM